ncbi:MAG: MtnX-like HAD-IB family phosphatase [Chloroflexota bacterium]
MDRQDRNAERRHAPAVAVLCDFDGTITEHDVWDAIVARFDERDWSAQARDYAALRLGSRQFYELQAREWTIAEDAVRAYVRASTRVDPHVAPFLALLRDHGVPLHIVSDGFGFYIREVLMHHGLGALPYAANELSFGVNGEVRLDFPYYRAECLRAMGNCKCTHLLACRERGERVVYIGDSYSDVCPVRHADLVFAKPSLAAYCAAHGIGHVPFASFAEIVASPQLAAMLAGDRPAGREG